MSYIVPCEYTIGRRIPTLARAALQASQRWSPRGNNGLRRTGRSARSHRLGIDGNPTLPRTGQSFYIFIGPCKFLKKRFKRTEESQEKSDYPPRLPCCPTAHRKWCAIDSRCCCRVEANCWSNSRPRLLHAIGTFSLSVRPSTTRRPVITIRLVSHCEL